MLTKGTSNSSNITNTRRGLFTLDVMGSAVILREGEARIISVTPVSWGVVQPLLASVVVLVGVVEGAQHMRIVHVFVWWLLAIVAGPLLLVTLTRIWRWRSHKVHVTSERVIVEGGVLSHRRTIIELHDVIATRVDQRFVERVTQRGVVALETAAGPLSLGKFRHPAAVCRLIDAERAQRHYPVVPLDTVFTFDEPSSNDYEVRPARRSRRRRGD